MVGINISQEEYDERRAEFNNPKFKEKMKKYCGDTCIVCNTNDNIEYHHLIPLSMNGTNNLSNIVPMCHEHHNEIHGKITNKRTLNNGRKKKITYEEAEPILDKYFNNEIGTKEAKEMLGISKNTKTTWYNLINEYKEKHNIDSFRNNIDLKSSQTKRINSVNKTKSEQLNLLYEENNELLNEENINMLINEYV